MGTDGKGVTTLAAGAGCPLSCRYCINKRLLKEAPRENLLPVLSAVDEFIVDCKDMNPDIYHRYTGGDAQLMRDNLEFLLASCGAERVLVRVPRIPGFNTAEDQRKSAEALRNMGVTRLDLFDYVVRAE